MPQSFYYPPILSLASPPRLASYQSTFSPQSDCELYGIYIWSQHVVGALYPITQTVEISLRNTIDGTARRRFGEKWWLLPQFNSSQTKDFLGNFEKAEKTLTRQWRANQRERLGLAAGASLLDPIWSHDKVVAATDFSTWEYVLRDDFSAPSRTKEQLYLWPRSTGKAFRKYNKISSSSVVSRHHILDLVREVREYRNRLFHHDKIWVSGSGATSARSAIDSIRKKINKMEELLGVIDSRLPTIMNKVGVLPSARRLCSINELDIYRYAHLEPPLTSKKKRVIRTITAHASALNATVAWSYGGSLYGLYKIR